MAEDELEETEVAATFKQVAADGMAEVDGFAHLGDVELDDGGRVIGGGKWG